MDNKKLKKLLVATLATSSIFSSFSAVAADEFFGTRAGGAVVLDDTNAGTTRVFTGSTGAAVADGAVTAGNPNTLVLGLAQDASVTAVATALLDKIDVNGWNGQTITINGNFRGVGGVAQILNSVANSYAYAAGIGGVVAHGGDANATGILKLGAAANDLKLSTASFANLSELDFDNKAGSILKINAATGGGGANKAGSAVITTKFINGGEINIDTANQWLTFQNDASTTALKVTAGNVVLNEDSIRTAALGANGALYVVTGKTLTGTVDGIATNQGTLVLEGGNVTGAVGTKSLALVSYTGAAGANSTITGALTTQALNVNSPAVLTVTGVANVGALTIGGTGNVGGLTANNAAGLTTTGVNYNGGTGTVSTITVAAAGLTAPTLTLSGAGKLIIAGGGIISGIPNTEVVGNATVDNANLQYNAASDLVKFDSNAKNNSATQILGAAALAKSSINTKVKFDGDHTLTINKTFQATQAITTKTGGEGQVTYVGAAAISANVGADGAALKLIQLGGDATAAANTINNAAVFSNEIKFGALADQSLTLSGTGSVTGAVTFVAQKGQSLVLNDTSSVTGNISFANDDQLVNLNGGSLSKSAVAFADKSSTVQINAENTKLDDTVTFTATNAGTIKVSAAGTVFGGSIGADAAHRLGNFIVDKDKDATVNENAFVTTTTLAEGATLTVSNKSTFTSAIDGAAKDNGILVLNNGNVTGAVGGGQRLAEVRFTGAEKTTSTITGGTTTSLVTFNGAGTLVFDGAILSGTTNAGVPDLVNGAIGVNAKGAKVQYNQASDLINFATVAEGEKISVIQVLNNAGDFNARSEIKTAINFKADATLKIGEGFQAQGITTTADNTGTVTYEGEANITKNIGEKNLSIKTIELAGAGNTIDATVFANEIKFGALAGQTLTLGKDKEDVSGVVNGAIILNAGQADQTLTLNNKSEVNGITGKSAITLGTAAAASNQSVTLNGSSAVKGGIQLGAAATQSVNLNGSSTVDTVNFGAKDQNVTLSDTAKVTTAVDFKNTASTVTLNSGSTLVSAISTGGVNGTVAATQGSNLGNVTGVNIVNANGVKFIGTTYGANELNVTGANTVENEKNQPVTFNNLITTGGASIDSSKGSKLTLVGAGTKIGDNTSLKLTITEGSLDLSNLAVDKFGATNLNVDLDIANSVEYQKKSVKELFAENNSIKLVTNVDKQEVADKFTVLNGAVLNYSVKYDDKEKALILSTSVNKDAFAQVGSVRNENKPLGKEALALIGYANTSGNLATARQKAAAIETTDVSISTVETVTSNVVGILNAIDNPGSNAALAPSAGEDYNEQGINAFVTPFIAKGTTKQNGDVAGSNYNAAGANLGLTAGINEDNTHLGLALTFANSTSKFKDAKDGDKAKGETKSLTIFGDHALGNNVVVQGILSLGVTDFKATQTIINKYEGKYTTKFASLLAKVGYNLNTGGSFKAMPYVGLRYDTYRDSAYDLKADKRANINVSSKTTNKFIASVGAKLTGSTESDGTHFAPFADVAFGYNFGKKSATKSIDIGNFNPNAKYSDSDKTIINGRLGVEARVEGGLNATLGGGLDLIGSKTTVYHGSLKLGYKF